MTPTPPLFRVLTSIVLNRDGTGYRGVYRTAPDVIAFTEGNMDLWEQSSMVDEFSELPPAIDEMELARRHGISCEIVACRVVSYEDTLEEVGEQGDLLGYDVAYPSSGYYSTIVDRCMGLWVPSDPVETSFSTLLVVAEYFNALLNENRLFADVSQAQRFLTVDRECASRFGGEMSCGELAIVSVRSVR